MGVTECNNSMWVIYVTASDAIIRGLQRAVRHVASALCTHVGWQAIIGRQVLEV